MGTFTSISSKSGFQHILSAVKSFLKVSLSRIWQTSPLLHFHYLLFHISSISFAFINTQSQITEPAMGRAFETLRNNAFRPGGLIPCV